MNYQILPSFSFSVELFITITDGVPVEYHEPDFVWEEYLQETGGTAVPPTAFKHVILVYN